MIELERKFPEQLNLLRELFKNRKIPVDDNLARLNEIHEVCEGCWERNLERLDGREVKYLLIAEAPPWTPVGRDISYFYKTFDGRFNSGRPTGWITSIWKIITKNSPMLNSLDDVFNELAKQGFLLVDTLPFAETYTTNDRKSSSYTKLVKSCLSYLLEKLDQVRLSSPFFPALAFEYNSKALISAAKGQIRLDAGPIVPLQTEIIASTGPNGERGSGFPSSSRLQRIWGLK